MKTGDLYIAKDNENNLGIIEILETKESRLRIIGASYRVLSGTLYNSTDGGSFDVGSIFEKRLIPYLLIKII